MPASQAGPIGIYDSGLGGLTVVPAIRRSLPGADLLYVADSGHLPYGEKSAAQVLARALRITDFMLAQGARAVAIPCNTATAAAIDTLRARHPGLPFVGIEPGVKPAARLTRSGVIGVLATSGTLASDRFRRLVDREAPAVRVLTVPCPGWVELVEQGGDAARVDAVVAPPLDALLSRGADVLVLGCTHFPLLAPAIRRRAGDGVALLETSEPFARQVSRQLVPVAGDGAAGGRLSLFTSGDPGAMAARIRALEGWAGELAGIGAGAVRALPAAYR